MRTSNSNGLSMFRLEDRVLFEAAAAAEVVDAADAAQDDPNADVNEGEKQAQEERDALKNAPPENPSAQQDARQEAEDPSDLSDVDAEIEDLINGEIAPSGGDAQDGAHPGPDGADAERELVIVNSSVADADDLLSTLKPNQDVLFLESGRDAMEQIQEYLDLHDDVKYDALHIVSHGNDGYFVLNGEVFSAKNFDASDWAEVGEHLTEDGDILLYGCNLADGESGRELIGMISDASGADVAASDDETGVSGDWDLEFRHGAVEADSLSGEGYQHNLENYLVTAESGTGDGTLEWAIKQANGHEGADEITFDESVTDVQLSGSQKITDSVTISGYLNGNGENAVTITAANGKQVFIIGNDKSAIDVVLENLNFKGNGRVGFSGGAIQNTGENLTLDNTEFSGFTVSNGCNGGAIYNNGGTLDIIDSYFHDNSSLNEASGPTENTKGGGAIFSDNAAVTITDSRFEDNQAAGFGGAVLAQNGSLSDNGSVFRGNSALAGGALHFNKCNVDLNGTLFSENHGDSAAGALYLNSYSSMLNASHVTFSGNTTDGDCGAFYNVGTASFDSCVFENNVAYQSDSGRFDADCGGGAIFNDGHNSGGVLTITDSLFSGNRCGTNSEAGGAIFNYSGGTLSLLNTTFHGNSAQKGGAIYNDAKSKFYAVNTTFTANEATNGGAIYNAGTAYFLNGIAAGNEGDFDIVNAKTFDCQYSAYGTISGFTDDGTHQNHAGESADTLFEGGGALQDNGGSSQSVLLSEYAAGFAAASVQTERDSRGIIYAFLYKDSAGKETRWEVAKPAGASVMSTEKVDHDQRGYLYGNGSGNLGAVLRKGYVAWSGAEDSAEATEFYTVADLQGALNDAGVDTLYWADTRILLGAQLTVGRDLALVGQGSDETILVSSGNGIFDVQSGDVTISDLAMDGNDTQKTGDGGAIVNKGNLTLRNVEFYNFNATGNGGAVWNAGTLAATGVIFTENSASSGAGGAVWNSGTARFESSYFAQNSAVNGGAVYNSGTATALNSTFNTNSATGKGSAWYASSGTSTLVNNTITAFSDDDGDESAGVYAASGSKLLALNNLAVSNGKYDFFAESGATTNYQYNVVTHADGMGGTNDGDATAATEFGNSRSTDNGGNMPSLRVLGSATASQERDLIVGEKDGAFYYTTSRDTGNMTWNALDPAGSGFTTKSVAEAQAMYVGQDGAGRARQLAGFYGAGAYAAKAIWGYYFTDPSKDTGDVLQADGYLYMPERGGVSAAFTQSFKDYDSLVDKTVYLADGWIDVDSITVTNDSADSVNLEVEYHFVGNEHTVLSGIGEGSIWNIGPTWIPDGDTNYDAALAHVTVTIEDVTMTRENSAYRPERGGCIRVEGNADLTVTDCEFHDSSATLGGAIYGAAALFATNDGGFNMEYIGPNITVDHCEFRDCEASYMGGAIFINDDMAGCKGKGPSSLEPGYAMGGSKIVSANGRGQYSAGKLTVLDSTFDGNSAAKAGGAIGVASVASVTPRGDYNLQTGFYYYDGSYSYNGDSYFQVEIRDSVFTGNRADGGGGAIYLDMTGWKNDGAGDNFALTGSTFTGNTAGDFGGGAVFFCGWSNDMSDVSIDADISGNFFDSNLATGDGGAIQLLEDSQSGFYQFFFSFQIHILPWHVVEQDFNLASAPVPGPAAAQPAAEAASPHIHLEMELNTFSGNRAGGTGGAFSSSVESAPLTVDMLNSTLAFNAAGTNGGAIYLETGSLNLVDSTVACNEAENGGVYTAKGKVDVINSIVLGNTGGEFAVDEAGGGKVRTAYSIYSGGAVEGDVASHTDAALADVFGKDDLGAGDLTRYGTLAINPDGIAFTGGARTARKDGKFYFLQGEEWRDLDGGTAAVSEADCIDEAQDSSETNGIVRVETSMGGYNVGAHAMVELFVDVFTEKTYDGTKDAPRREDGGYDYRFEKGWSTNPDLEVSEDMVELEFLEYLDKNAGKDKDLSVRGRVKGFSEDSGRKTPFVVEGQDDQKGYADESLYVVKFQGKGDIDKAHLTVTGNEERRKYDGQEHTVEGWSDVEGLVEGDTLQSVEGTASGTDVGEYDQKLSDAFVVDGEGNDMTGNYDVEYRDGLLEIDPAKVHVSVDADKTYDGTTGYDVSTDRHTVTVDEDESGLLDSDDFELQRFEYGGKNAGDYTEADGTNGDTLFSDRFDSKNFEIEYEYGGTIERAHLTVTGNEERRKYDGQEHTVEGWSDVEGLVEGDTLQSVEGTASGTDVGEYDQKLSDAFVVDGEGNDMTGNYDVEYRDGLLEIDPAKVHVSVDADKTYDGTTGYDVSTDRHTVTVDEDESGLLDSDDFELQRFEYGGKNAGDYTEADGTNGDTLFSDRFDSKNFEIEYEYGGTIDRAHLTVTGNEERHEYDGREHSVEGWSDVEGLVGGDTLQSVDGVARGTEVGEYDQKLSDAFVVDGGGNDMTGNYDVEYRDGRLTIYAGPGDEPGDEPVYDHDINEWQQPYIYNWGYTSSTESLGPGSDAFYWGPHSLYWFDSPSTVLDPVPDGESRVGDSLNFREPDDSLEDYFRIGGVKFETVLNRYSSFKDEYESLVDSYADGDASYSNSQEEAVIAEFSRALY